MNRAASLLLAAALGALLCFLLMDRATVPAARHNALQEAFALEQARSLDLASASRLWADSAARAQAFADSLRNVRKVVRAAALAAPDSAARAQGLHVAAPDSMTRCLPVAELAELLAARAELGLADSTAAYDLAALAACGEALALSDSSATVARGSAQEMHTAAQELAQEAAAARRARWWWAAGGAAGAVLLILAGGAL